MSKRSKRKGLSPQRGLAMSLITSHYINSIQYFTERKKVSSEAQSQVPTTKSATSRSLTQEIIYIKNVEKDTQQAVKVPQGVKIGQMQIWKDTLFILTKVDKKLMYATDLSGLEQKITLKAHPSFKDCRVKKIAFGQDHMLILSEEGVVFGIGSNDQGQLGLTNQVKIVSTPLHMGKEIFQISVLTLFIEEGIFIEDIECGANCSLFKSKTSEQQEEQLYGCGLSTYGELGLVKPW